MTIIPLITIMAIMNILQKKIGTHISYYVQQLLGLFLRCCIVRQKCIDLTLWSRYLCSLSFQGCPLDMTTSWWVTVRSNSGSCTRHVSRVHFFNSSKGVTSGDIPDHMWDTNWPYLSNSTLSAWWCRWFRHLHGNWIQAISVVVGYKCVQVVVFRHNWVHVQSGAGIWNGNMKCY